MKQSKLEKKVNRLKKDGMQIDDDSFLGLPLEGQLIAICDDMFASGEEFDEYFQENVWDVIGEITNLRKKVTKLEAKILKTCGGT